MKKRIACVIGTRPEAVKMAPLIQRLRSESAAFDTTVISTGQHGSILNDALNFFDIRPDITLDLMVPNQSLWELTARASQQLGLLFQQMKPQWVLVQGDTTSAFVAAYCAFLTDCKVGHVEAGLRTYKKYSPFPEEINRRLISGVADLHFAPTRRAVEALLSEGIKENSIFMTGNTIVDALGLARQLLKYQKVTIPPVIQARDNYRKLVLVTAHRRENHQSGLSCICHALRQFLAENPDYSVIFQVHPNPAVKILVTSLLSETEGVLLIEPQPYGTFVGIMMAAEFILTDSGGIQEEGPSLGKPVLIAREDTERLEAIEAGCNELVGVTVESILTGLRSMARDQHKCVRMSQVQNPFGDGGAAARIIEVLRHH